MKLSVPIYHRVCHGVAFRYDHVPHAAETVEPQHAVPARRSGDVIRCQTCGRPVRMSELRPESGPLSGGPMSN